METLNYYRRQLDIISMKLYKLTEKEYNYVREIDAILNDGRYPTTTMIKFLEEKTK